VTRRGRWRRGETVGSEKIRGEGRRREGQGAGGGRTGSPRGRRRRRGRPSFAERAAESIGSAIPRSKGGEQRPPVGSNLKRAYAPAPPRIPFSLRADITLAAVRLHPAEADVEGGAVDGLRPRPAPPALPAPLPAGSVQGGVRPQQDPSTVPEVPADPSGGVEGGGGVEAVRGCPSPPGPTTPSPRSRLHPVEADVEGGAAGPAPQKAAAKEGGAPLFLEAEAQMRPIPKLGGRSRCYLGAATHQGVMAGIILIEIS
jgi:hypothetical protein